MEKILQPLRLVLRYGYLVVSVFEALQTLVNKLESFEKTVNDDINK